MESMMTVVAVVLFSVITTLLAVIVATRWIDWYEWNNGVSREDGSAWQHVLTCTDGTTVYKNQSGEYLQVGYRRDRFEAIDVPLATSQQSPEVKAFVRIPVICIQEVATLLRARGHSSAAAEVVSFGLQYLTDENDIERQRYIDTARSLYSNCKQSFDDDACLSETSDGAWVQGWSYVAEKDVFGGTSGDDDDDEFDDDLDNEKANDADDQ